MNYLHRYSKINVSEDDHLMVKLEVTQYLITRQTNCFYIIKIKGKERRVPKNGKKVFARISASKALEDFIIRSQYSISLSKKYIKLTKMAIDQAKSKLKIIVNN